MPLQRRTYAITYDELEAIRRLQEGSDVPEPDDPVWRYLLSLSLVWLDTAPAQATFRLTASGRGYATA